MLSVQRAGQAPGQATMGPCPRVGGWHWRIMGGCCLPTLLPFVPPAPSFQARTIFPGLGRGPDKHIEASLVPEMAGHLLMSVYLGHGGEHACRAHSLCPPADLVKRGL